MSTSDIDRLREIRTFPSLVKYLRDELDWPVESVEDFEDLTFDWSPEELGIDLKTAAKIESIKQLRPLASDQPWGIFFVKFEPKRLPVVALRRILGRVVVKKRASASSAERASWEMNDLLFISNYGDGEERQISLAHFSQGQDKKDLPVLKVLGWDNRDTPLHLDHVASELRGKLAWPANEEDIEGWRETWGSAFTLRHREVITTSKELALRLAELARSIRTRIGSVLAVETEKGPVTKLMKAFKEALVHDLTEDDFADMYAQTIAYGLLTARISRPAGLVADNIADMVPITNPFLKELLEAFLDIGGRKGNVDFDELGVGDVVDMLRDAKMEAVLRDFGDRNPQEDPVIHFYELFLKEYDAKKRMQRGVFYTPRPVVSFIVRSVDELLRTEFGLEDGLADTTTWGEMAERHEGLEIPEGASPDQTFIQILDPATGTGTFLVEVIDIIYKTMTKKWRDEGRMELELPNLWNDYVPEHLLPRLYGYELLMAPYAIAHMKIGLKLYETGYRFGSDERARVYLTNALEPEKDFSGTLAFAIPALAHEAEAVNAIKRDQRFTVVIGNPPYAKLSSNREEAAEALVAPFKVAVRDERNIQPLSDDYVKFFGLSLALSERVRGFVFGMITNRGHLIGLIHRGMRQVISSSWPKLWVVDLHGDSNVRESAPDGAANENVFDIQQGVAITIGAKKFATSSSVSRWNSWGTRDEKQIQLNGLRLSGTGWVACAPQEPYYFFEAPTVSEEAGEDLFPLCTAMPMTNTGIKTHRDSLVIDFDSTVLEERIRRFSDPERSDADVRSEFFGLGERGRYKPGDNRDWSMSEARSKLQRNERPLKDFVRPLEYRPFDRRSIFYSADVIDFAREDLMQHMEGGQNIGLVATRQVPNGDFCHAFVTRCLIEMKTGSHDRSTNLFPLWLRRDRSSLGLGAARQHNFSQTFFKALAKAISLPWDEAKALPIGLSPEEILGQIYAVLNSPSYRSRYADLLRINFPPIPIPCNLDLFRSLSILGEKLITFHLLESSQLEDHITELLGTGDFQVEKVSYSDETVWIDKAKTRGFRGVPEEVWNFHIGGYQVCHKWLKDRQAKGGKNPRPGRVLTDEDIDHYQKIVVALSQTIRIMGEIDEVVDKHGGWPDAFVVKK